MRRLIALVFLFGISYASAVYAHARIDSSEPADGQVLTSSPKAIKITFSEEVRPNESYIKLFDAQKKQIQGITTPIDAETLSEALPRLPSGVYMVKWKAVCLCTDHHATKGSFTFTVQ